MDKKCMHEGLQKTTQRSERGGGCSSDVINDLQRFPLLFKFLFYNKNY